MLRTLTHELIVNLHRCYIVCFLQSQLKNYSFFKFLVWVNQSLSSMFSIIKHIKEKVLSFFL